MIGGMVGLFRDNISHAYIPTREERERGPSKKVFISYSHRDLEVTFKLRQKLESYGLRILIDVDALPPGKSIREFISESIRTSDATISIVSRHGLMSTWVALETIVTRHSEKKIFGCFVDEDFFKRGFVDEALSEVATQMREIGELIKKRVDNQVSFEDLYQDWKDYLNLRSNVDTIVRDLRGSACLSLNEEVFEESCKKLAKALGQLNE